MIICGSHGYSQPKCRAGQCKEHFGPMVVTLLAAAALAVWLYLIAGRGGFWLASERDDKQRWHG